MHCKKIINKFNLIKPDFKLIKLKTMFIKLQVEAKRLIVFYLFINLLAD